MNADVPHWAEAVVALLLVLSGMFVVISAVGFSLLRDFFLRMHAPAICYTLGSWSIGLASLLYFSAGEKQLTLHVWLVVVILAVTAPITTVLLARAALFRSRQAGRAIPKPLLSAAPVPDKPLEE
jgi:multicomponent K+:H+ antiporter subunit G